MTKNDIEVISAYNSIFTIVFYARLNSHHQVQEQQRIEDRQSLTLFERNHILGNHAMACWNPLSKTGWQKS